ncbi:hypothetical protein QTP88_025680 [Uroleucon formosanum]
MSKVGLASHLWAITAHSNTSRKNICYTLSVKHQLRLASKSNTLSLSSEPSNAGKVIDISRNEIEKIENNIFNQTLNLNSMSFVSWVQVKGTRYTTKQRMIVIIDVKDMPIFIINIKKVIDTDDLHALLLKEPYAPISLALPSLTKLQENERKLHLPQLVIHIEHTCLESHSSILN